jgi:hypothetical protein
VAPLVEKSPQLVLIVPKGTPIYGGYMDDLSKYRNAEKGIPAVDGVWMDFPDSFHRWKTASRTESAYIQSEAGLVHPYLRVLGIRPQYPQALLLLRIRNIHIQTKDILEKSPRHPESFDEPDPEQ